MSDTLPPSVQAYFTGKNARDFALAVSGFASHAVVKDEHKDHVGLGEIAEWIKASTAAYDDQVTVQHIEADGAPSEGEVVVTGEVAGNFPGSPIVLRFRFGLADGLIERLAIGG